MIFSSFDIPGVVVGTDVVEDGPDVILGDDALVGCTAVTAEEKKPHNINTFIIIKMLCSFSNTYSTTRQI